jgi:uncharacterized protein YdeI (YjbR/CyaY-like superfamily)
MEISKTFYAPTRTEWRAWLQEHYQSEAEIWLVYYKKESGKPRIPYADAVKEALCFGWIDSNVITIDEESFAQKFSPRKLGITYSQPNKERLKVLLEEGLVLEDVRQNLGDVVPEAYIFPDDIIEVLKSNPQAWENFQGFSPPYQRIRIAFIDSARKRPEVYEKRLNHFIRMTAQDKQYGVGIEEFFT